MDLKLRNKLFLIIISLMIIFPIIINLLMMINIFPVKGDYQVWIPTLGTFWGAIIGGVISGVLTLFGVNKTIKSSFEGMERNSEQQQLMREKEIEIESCKERLTKLYHPIYAMHSSNIFKYGAHDFSDLTLEEQHELIKILDKNIIYGDISLDTYVLELKWAFNAKDFEEADELYNSINDNIDEELLELRKILKLPSLRHN